MHCGAQLDRQQLSATALMLVPLNRPIAHIARQFYIEPTAAPDEQ